MAMGTTELTAGPTRQPLSATLRRPAFRWGGPALFAASFLTYTAIGMVLTLHYNLVDGDGPSRVADAGYVLFSRDPHLGAIGFVWNPLPSLVELPFLLLKGVWAPLQTRGQAGTLQSALFMAAAVCQVRLIALDRGVPRGWRWLLIAGFAINPMIVMFGGNGLSEAALLFCTTWAARRLMLWMRTPDTVHLVVAGLALTVGYLARYESLAAAVGAAALVAGTSAWRARTTDGGRLRLGYGAGLYDAALLMFPVLMGFIIWAASSLILIGQPFTQFSSQYGNSSQVSSSHVGQQVTNHLAVLESALRAMVSLEPLLPTVLVIAAALAIHRRAGDLLAPLVLFGGILSFEAVAQLDGLTFGWFRFYLSAIPLCVCAVATLWDPDRPPAIGLGGASVRRWSGLACGLLAAAVLVPSLPITWSAMLNPVISNQFDQVGLRYLFTAARAERDTQPEFDDFRDDQAIAGYLDAQHLPNGSVLVDTYQGWDIWLSSDRPKQFVITSDYNFLSALNAPAQSGIRYILDSNPSYDNSVDAVNHRYPSLWATGAGIATLQLVVTQRGGGQSWRIYRVIGSRGTGLAR
jgi:hypothetical protein